MKRNYYANATFRKIHIIYTFFLILIILIFSCGYMSWIFTDVQEQNKKTATWISNEIGGKIDKSLSQPQAVLNNLYQSPWIVKYMSNAFENDFSSYDYFLYRKEVQALTYSAPIQSLILIFPERDTAITGIVSGSIENCISNILINYKVDLTQVIEQIRRSPLHNQLQYPNNYYDAPNHLLFLHNLEITKNPRGYAIFVIEKATLEEPVLSHFQQDSDKRLLSASLVITQPNGTQNAIYQVDSGEQLRADRTLVVDAVLPGFSYALTFHDVLGQENSNRIILLLFSVPLLVLLCILFSYWASIISLRPVEHFLGKVASYHKTGSARISFEVAEEVFDGLVDENSKIIEENVRMRETTELYRSTVRNAFLVRLVRGYFMNMDEWKHIDQSLRSYDLPFDDQSYFCVTVLHDDRTIAHTHSPDGSMLQAPLQDLRDFLAQNRIMSTIVELSFRETVLILADTDTVQKNQVYSYLDQRISASGIPLITKSGPQYRGLIGISTSYHKAISGLKMTDTAASDPHFYYPLAWQKQLVDNFRLGNEDVKNRILQEIISENTKIVLTPQDEAMLFSLLQQTVTQIIEENALNPVSFQADMERFLSPATGFERWDILLKLGDSLFQTIMQQKNEAATSEPGQSIICYIHEHFSESTLSLKELSDQFNLSISAVSRTVKKSTGVNFLEYMTGLRMEAAKQLLFAGDHTIQTISSMVGYENTYSFRRAFERFEGIRLQDYRKEQKKDLG